VNDRTRRIRVFLAVSNRLLREVLSRILQKKLDIFVAGESPDLPNALGRVAELETEIILMDSVSEPPSNLRFISRVRDLHPGVQVVMVGMDGNEGLFLSAIRAGVSGYLLNEASAPEVIAAIRAVSQGAAVCPPQLCVALFKSVAHSGRCVPAVQKIDQRLTRRQQELMPMIARGLTNKEIASHLNLSEQTVKNHIHRLLRRVGATDRLEVAKIADVQEVASPY
jgi:DNA-binding NarL/FixJ family response regulator